MGAQAILAQAQAVLAQAPLEKAFTQKLAPLLLTDSVLGMMHLRLLLLGISVAAGSLRGLQTGTALPSSSEMSTVATPITTPLPATAMSTNAATTATLPPVTSASTSAMPNTTAMVPIEDLWGLPVVENATYLATSGVCIGRYDYCPRSTDRTTCERPRYRGPDRKRGPTCRWEIVTTTTPTTTTTRYPPRPTTCPQEGGIGDGRRCEVGFWKHITGVSEFDRCSCGIGEKNIPGPDCSRGWDRSNGIVVKPTPYWGTGQGGCTCWCAL